MRGSQCCGTSHHICRTGWMAIRGCIGATNVYGRNLLAVGSERNSTDPRTRTKRGSYTRFSYTVDSARFGTRYGAPSDLLCSGGGKVLMASSNKLAGMLLEHVYLIVLSVEGMEITMPGLRACEKHRKL